MIMSTVLLSACDPSTAGHENLQGLGCTTGAAHIQVLDGMMIRTCGCAEANDTIFSSGQTLTCTVNIGTKIYFDFVATTVTHQVTITSVSTTPIVNPSTTSPVQTYTITPTATGTFQFYDIFFPTLGGSIVVN